VKSVRAFFTVAGGLVKYTFLLGGGILFINNIISRFGIEANALITAVSGIMLTCILAFGIERKRHGHICRAVLIRNGKSITVRALIDSGNSLVEPISGKAVSVLDTKLFNELYDGDEAFRAVPFHSVGRAHGLLKGYFIDELKVERNGIQKSYGNVCVAVGADEVFGDGGRSIGLIINPEIFRA
ncbi:MAG: sigma-E processing peptidase SpoIIGA, partial [Lachnospiraceae bacterium]|nr:sigma-E processing peptidase SpoIIGA [Lachnospiraceae bacterium]